MGKTICLEEHFVAQAVKESHSVTNLALHMFPEVVRNGLLELGQPRVDDMDRGGVSVQVISHIPAFETPEVCRSANEQLSASVKAYPTRYAGFACLPMGDPSAAAAELEYCVREYGFVGALIPNHVQGMYYDGDDFLQFWQKAVDLDIPIYLHPAPSSPGQREYFKGNYPDELAQIMSNQVWGWHADVAVHVLRLYGSGLFDKIPKLKVVIGHMGEMLPCMIERAEVRMSSNWGSHTRTFTEVWKENFWITTSGMWYLAPMACLLRSVAIDRILYSIDYPLEEITLGGKFLDDLQKSGMVSQHELEMIAYKNAEILLKIKVEI
ncbi:hypothetical protein LTR17_027440 [Elasticomyces elasticus]|nr:hypothetical protein LTR17_027440 [Elasticomyces elasticus]